MEVSVRFEHNIQRRAKQNSLWREAFRFSHLYGRWQGDSHAQLEGRKSLSVGGGTVEEQAEAFKTFLAYAGRYTFSGDKVTHHVEISSIQNYVDRNLVRSVKFR